MFIKHAAVSAGVLEAVQATTDHPSLLRTAHRVTFNYEPRKGFIYVRSRAISSRTNDNFDTFPADELRKSWRTFIGKPVFVNHHNDDHTRMRGVIIDAALHEDTAPDGTDDTWIEVLMEVDAKRFPKLARALIKREIERTSMGCDVITSECSYCGNVSKTPEDYCVHVQRMKGQRLRRKNPDGSIEDVLVHEICRGISFFENSLLVEDPADPTAYTFGLDVRGVLDEEDEIAALASKTASSEIRSIGPCQRCGERTEFKYIAPICERCSDEIAAGGPLRLWDAEIDKESAMKTAASLPAQGDTFEYGGKPVEVVKVDADMNAVYVTGLDSDPNVGTRLLWEQLQQEGGSMWGVPMVTASKTGANEYGPLAPGRDAGTRWEDVLTDGRGYSVSVLWPGDEVPLLSGVFGSFERAVEWAGMAKDAGGMHISIRDNGAGRYIPSDQWRAASKTASEYPLADTRMHSNTSESYEEWACPNCGSPYFSGMGGDKFVTCSDCKTRYVFPELDLGKTAASEFKQERSPDKVETLRMQECPVCGSDSAWNPDGRCDVCGYLPPPRPFQEPDTDVAGRADRSGGWFDPDLTVAPPFKPGDYDKPGEDTTDPVRPGLSATKGQRHSRQGDQNMAQSTKSVAAVARQRVAAQSARPAADLAAENDRLRQRIAALTKKADEENPAQPVPEPGATAPVESGQETMNEPDKQNVDVETPGGVLPDPQSASSDVTSVGGEMADPIQGGSVDVEAPVAGTTEVDPNASEQTLPNTDAETMGDPAFAGDWLNEGADTVPNIDGNAAGAPEISASAMRADRARLGRLVNASRDRIWASIRLANLQLQSGIAQGDLIDVARQIEASQQSVEAINAQVGTIQAMAAARPRQATQAPNPGRVARRAPSLAAGSMPVVGGLSVRDARDEALFEA